jgi:hypothetical protein
MGFAEDLDDKRSLRKETVMMQQAVVYLPEVYNMNYLTLDRGIDSWT